MIAANFYKHTEALRFQREMFFNGYKNQPRIMRLMQCVFSQAPSAPSWWNAVKARARALAKSVKKAIMPLFDKNGKAIEPTIWTFKKMESPAIEQMKTPTRWSPMLNNKDVQDKYFSGKYWSFCRICHHFRSTVQKGKNPYANTD